MSNIIAFKAETRKFTTPPEPQDCGQILFFTGVRYMRDDETPAPSQPDLADLAAAAIELAAVERLHA